ncbi:MAG: hypothetical protein GTO53_11215 [Planctomycetales bacterium]|nr:hypothetical protein [Planctomycetales bacterium]NIM09685.1 hypothetical protein [Planctomycetales bacterium]NIN09162.1 hypothetical protein [Planctomycetales bacterium]NIN78269.1 hypothetical protein [Planctomycetales bacterium]NIO35460.1 hypothetical protein [Planctomycetales bacterium]
MKALRIAICPSVIAASLALVTVSESRAQVAVLSPGPAVVQPVYRPIFPRAWWRRPISYLTFGTVAPVTSAPLAAVPMTTTAARVTTFRPVVASAGNCTTCCPTQQCFKICEPRTTCRLVPQICFRDEQVQVPVTTMRAFTTVDPCTGCSTTCMKPVTTMVCQTRRVPYTTYRQVCSTVNVERTVCRQVMSCSSCAPAVVPTALPAVAAPAACPTCPAGNGSAHVGPPTDQPQLQAAPLAPEPTETQRPETPPANHGNGSHQSTSGSKSMQELDAGYQPEFNAPFPNLDDKTTQATGDLLWSLATLPATPVAARPRQQLDDSGWHAAAR